MKLVSPFQRGHDVNVQNARRFAPATLAEVHAMLNPSGFITFVSAFWQRRSIASNRAALESSIR